MIDLQFTTEQSEIIEAVGQFLSDELPIDRLMPRPRPVENEDRRLWRRMGDLGYFSLALPESHGGLGLSLSEEIGVFREFGRYLVSPAVLATVIGARIAIASGEADLAAQILAGRTQIGLACPFRAGQFDKDTAGDVHLIEVDEDVDWIAFWTQAGAGLAPREGFVDTNSVQPIDSTIRLARARLPSDSPRLWVAAEDEPITRRAWLLCAAMMVGMAEGACAGSVEYSKTRQQFGQPIGAFQSVKNRCADMLTRSVVAWSQTLFATLWMETRQADAAFQAIAAVISAVEAATKNAAANIQNHGATGFTGENMPHLYVKRTLMLERLTGGAAYQQSLFLSEAAPL